MSVPSATVLVQAAKVALEEDRPIYLDYYADSIAKKLIVEYEEKQRRLQDWGKKRNRIAEFFRNLFRKKSLMEKLQSRRSF